MPHEIVPFEAGHLEAASRLLAGRHSEARAREPRLPAHFESERAGQLLLEKQLEHGRGVVALDGETLTGYLLGSHDLGWGNRTWRVPLEGHAATGPDAYEIYREMYAAASASWVRDGFFLHAVDTYAEERPASDAWLSLGFGRELCMAIRDADPAGSRGGRARIQRAGEEDIDTVMELLAGLWRYNSSSPLYRPYVAPLGTSTRREPLLQQLGNKDCAFWLAFDEDDRPVGLMIFTPPEPDELMISPDNCVYLWIAYVSPSVRAGGVGLALVDAGLAWAREQGREFCTVGFFTTNLTGARFWLGRGFKPAFYRLQRRLDERIAWANASG